MKRISFINIIVGIILMAIEILFSIGGKIGFFCFSIGFILFVAGIVFNKKIRELVSNFILNFW